MELNISFAIIFLIIINLKKNFARNLCEDNWLQWNNKCFYVGEALERDDHLNYCEDRKATLVSIHSSEENQFIRSLIPRREILLSGLHTKDNINFFWNDGTSFDYNNWRRRPRINSIFENSNFAINSDGKWKRSISNNNHVICQKLTVCLVPSNATNNTSNIEGEY